MKIADLKTSELVNVYNTFAEKFDDIKPIKKFSDRKTALRRVTKLVSERGSRISLFLPELDELGGKKEKKATAKRVGFNFPPKYDVPKKVREGSLRERAIKMLKQGATQDDIENLCDLFHCEKGITPRNVERRAYELIRLINHYVGYGLREKDGLIYAYTKQDEMDV